ncbi:MAG: hypothetical protein MJ131_10370 [Lachnospiraceae bacterium]|nr:hypothetical protein [Lachnospiraceae bacterium]
MNTNLTAQQLAQRNAQQAQNLHAEANSLYAVKQENGQLVAGPKTQAQVQTEANAIASLKANLRTAIPVVVPQQISQDEIYSKQQAQESMSASKRKSRIETKGHPLNQKAQNDAQVRSLDEQKEAQWKMALEIVSAHPQFNNLIPKERDAILKLCLSDNPSVIYSRFDELMSQEKKYTALNEYVRELMSIDINSIDISSDTKILEQSKQFERMGNLADGIYGMLDMLPDYKNSLSVEAGSLLMTKLQKIRCYSDYYKAKKILMTDKYYSTHLNSECSVAFDPTATAEQNMATHKIWVCESALKELNTPAIAHRMNEPLTDPHPELVQPTLLTKQYETEPGKNIAPPLTRTHAATLANIQTNNPAMTRALEGSIQDPYSVVGDTLTSKESFVRHLHNLSWLKATGEMDAQELQQMLTLLSSRPSATVTPVEARANNIVGLKAFKLLLKNQTKYLVRKYGSGLAISGLQEYNDHNDDYSGDFANMQGFLSLMEYARSFPDVWDESDDLFLKQYSYITMAYFSTTYCKLAHQQSPSATANFSENQRIAAGNVIPVTGLDIRLIDCMDALKDEHADINWDAVMDVKEVCEIFRNPQLLAARKAKYASGENDDPTDWLTYFPELKSIASSKKEILKQMLGELCAPMVAMNMPEWSKGPIFGAINIPGIGTDDQITVNSSYERFLANPAAYGLDDQATEQLRGLVKQWQEVGLKINTDTFYEAKILALTFNAPAATAAPETVAAARLFNELNRLGNDYGSERANITATTVNSVRDQLLQFMTDHNLFTYDVHKNMYQTEITDKAQQMAQSVQLDLGNGVTVNTYPTNTDHPGYSLAELLKDKHLKADADINDFNTAVANANEIMPLLLSYIPMIDEGVQHENDLTQADSFANITTKKGFFLYDIYNRASVLGDRLLDIFNKIRGMVE